MTAGISISLGPSPARREVLAKRIRLLVALTITYNVIEAIVALTAGTLASSTALIGFGLDSIIEVSSAAAVAWQFSAADHAVREAREQRTLRIIAVSFFALAAYVTSTRPARLTARERFSRSRHVIAACAGMHAFLSYARARRPRLGTLRVCPDSKQTLLCTYLSAVLLVGLVLNATLGWSWADPIAALVIAAIAVKEGRDAWQGKGCCAPNAAATASAGAEGDACGSCGPGCACCTPAPGAKR
ncbi:cation transporter [Streptomyces sp. DHE17-7]|uniref:cation transporter n=1 Tax=Streptomyces sp. DHE17-7 TaxID=2759949 RepID=UPI0022EB1C5B|nr:cation transporter [Streptomyces sp. DHE17-7]MBJ6622356.1 cation transporter [Streptomyces sp. DHE17-7]